MIFYEFMNLDHLKQDSEIKQILRKRLDIDINATWDTKEKGIYKYLEKSVRQQCFDRLLQISKIYPEGKEEKALVENIVGKIKKVISEPMNYIYDLQVFIYLGLLYYIPERDYFSHGIDCKLENECKKSIQELEKLKEKINKYGERLSEEERESINEKRKELEEISQEYRIIKEIEKKKEEIQSVWGRKSNDNKIDKDEVRKYYPTQMEESIEKMWDEKGQEIVERNIKSIPGGCLDFHHTLISKSNIGIFDINSGSESYRKYSFPRAFKIYESLKDTPVENLLLMELSLGIGYVNQIYQYSREILTYNDLDEIIDFVVTGANIVPFFIRGKIIECILPYIDMYNKGHIRCATKILEMCNEVISQVFEDVLELWWYIYWLERGSSDIFEISDKRISDKIKSLALTLEYQYQKFFSMDIAYRDWLEICNVHDWRGINSLQDCLQKGIEGVWIEESGISLFDYLTQTYSLSVTDIKENIYQMSIGICKNKIGEKLLKSLLEKTRKSILPEDKEERHKLYESILQKEFDHLRKEDEKKFNGKDVKIRADMKTVNKVHIYAYLQMEVVSALLLKIRSLRNFAEGC